jgi:hypothetical protein
VFEMMHVNQPVEMGGKTLGGPRSINTEAVEIGGGRTPPLSPVDMTRIRD